MPRWAPWCAPATTPTSRLTLPAWRTRSAERPRLRHAALRQLRPPDAADRARRPLRPPGRDRPLRALPPRVVRCARIGAAGRHRRADVVGRDGARPAGTARDVARRRPLSALRRATEDGAQPIAMGSHVAAGVPARARRVADVRPVPGREGARAAADVGGPGGAA